MQNTADIDRSNPALVLTHALTNVTFAPSKKKNNTGSGARKMTDDYKTGIRNTRR